MGVGVQRAEDGLMYSSTPRNHTCMALSVETVAAAASNQRRTGSRETVVEPHSDEAQSGHRS